jgi:hypothetical protein
MRWIPVVFIFLGIGFMTCLAGDKSEPREVQVSSSQRAAIELVMRDSESIAQDKKKIQDREEFLHDVIADVRSSLGVKKGEDITMSAGKFYIVTVAPVASGH